MLHDSGQTSRLRSKPESSSLARELSAVNINFFSRTHIHAGAVRTEVSVRGLPKDFKVPKFRPLWQPRQVQQQIRRKRGQTEHISDKRRVSKTRLCGEVRMRAHTPTNLFLALVQL